MKRIHYSWVITLVGAGILVAQGISWATFSIFLKPLTEAFSWDRGALSGAYSQFQVVHGLLSILTGRLSDKYGPRILLTGGGILTGTGLLLMSRVSSLWQVYLTWGLVMAAGSSLIWIPIASTVPRWFAQKGGLAVSIATAGYGVGTIILPRLTQWLISSYAWQRSFVILGLIAFIIIIPLAQFMRHSPQRIGLKPFGEISEKSPGRDVRNETNEGANDLSFTQAIKTRHFWVYGFMLFCMFFAVQMVNVHIFAYAVDIGIRPFAATNILAIIAIASIGGRLLLGLISGRVSNKSILNGCYLLLILTLIWLQFASKIWMFYLFAIAFGLAFGTLTPLNIIMPAELFGRRFLGVIMATAQLLGTTGGATGTTSGGYIFDITRSYSVAILVAIVFASLALVLSLALPKRRATG